jgi:hypothetical protein
MATRPIPTAALHDYDMVPNPRKKKDTYLDTPAEKFIADYIKAQGPAFADWFKGREKEREEAKQLYQGGT